MMKRKILLLILLLATAVAAVNAQENRRRGVALGADRDTLLYIIASPFDNWYINIGGGVQTFIGNEVTPSARLNKLNVNGRVEVGKWVLPDLSVSLRLSAFNVDGQSRYGLQPFIDFTGVPTHVEDGVNYYEYQKFHAHAVALLGFVTLDWTNFLSGYELGKRNHWHVSSPIGLGASMLYGEHVNPRSPDLVGTMRKNFELAFSGGVMVEYVVNRNLAFNAAAELFGSESTWDWSPYDNERTRFDLVPSLSVGMRLNLLKHVTKYDPYTGRSRREKVNHEFVSFGTRNTVSSLNGQIAMLNSQKDSIQNLADQREANDAERRAADSVRLSKINQQLDDLQRQRDSALNQRGYMPANVLEELILVNEELNLPATIVYFQLDRYELDYNGRKRLQNFSRDVAAMDDTVEFFVIGAADSATGTVRHNQWLSERRCETAYNMLVNRFGVSGNQLKVVPVGGITEYEPQENNRMVMVIMRTPETEEIVNRWLGRRKR